jgi:two-component system, NtrC family, sensor kinase
MGRRATSRKGKGERPRARTPKGEGVRARELDQRLAESLEREKATARALTDALAQQTATSEVLRAIGRVQTDAQPVFDMIAASALQLCGAGFGQLALYDGKLLHMTAFHNVRPEGVEAIRRRFPAPADRGSAMGRAIQDRRVVHIPDLVEDPEYAFKGELATMGFRALLVVPMLRQGEPIGAIGVGRAERGEFPDQQVDLLKTFADQAVIAVENVRLFTEVQARTAELTQSVDELTALGEVSRALNSTLDLETVLQTIVTRANKIAGTAGCTIWEYDEPRAEFRRRASDYADSADAAVLQAPGRVTTVPRGQGVTTRVMERRQPVQIHDITTAADYESPIRGPLVEAGHRALLGVPLLSEDAVIGVLAVTRKTPGEFEPRIVRLLSRFATQSTLAIRNARLFREIEDKSHELETISKKFKELYRLSTVMQEPLSLTDQLRRVLESARQVIGIDRFIIWSVPPGNETLTVVAAAGFTEEEQAELSGIRMPLADGPLMARSFRDNVALVFNEDHPIPPELRLRPPYSRVRPLRTNNLASVPLIARGTPVGVLSADNRARRVPIQPDTIELLQTFASHAAVAIENARLFREIADQSRQLEVASRHKSEFLANMSHELRTPLNAILGFSEILAEGMFGDINDKQAEYLGDILESGRHLLSLINDILDLSKIEAGRMELEATDFDLPTAIDNTLTLVRERAGRRGITLGRAIDGRVRTIRADERKVKQVVLNLLSNALKFTPEGGRIDVRASLGEGLVEVSVADTGVGIAPEDQEAVFEEFRQVGTADKNVEGTGLGLALSRKFIGLHGGRIWVESKLGQGSTFTFTLPVRHEPGDRGTAPREGA